MISAPCASLPQDGVAMTQNMGSGESFSWSAAKKPTLNYSQEVFYTYTEAYICTKSGEGGSGWKALHSAEIRKVDEKRTCGSLLQDRQADEKLH